MSDDSRNPLGYLFPIFEQLRGYDGSTFGSDVAAGLTTAVMLVPQGMAYALLAGLPPIMGLYASMVPLVLYALLGTSRQLAVGPVAMASLLIAAGVAELPGAAEFTGEQIVTVGILLTLLAGVAQVLMGAARLGFLVNFLSHPVITGFTSAAAIIIAASQIEHLLGMSFEPGLAAHEVLWATITRLGEAHAVTAGIGVGAIALIAGLKRWRPTFPAALTAVVLGIVVSWQLDLPGRGVAILGEIPAGLPTPSIPDFEWSTVERMVPMGLTIALITFMESISAAKVYAREHGYEVRANRELVGLGVANLASGLFGGCAVGGALSRTAVNDQAGARTQVAALVTAAAITATLLFLTPLFFYLPKAVLAAIIMLAVVGLFDFQEMRFLWEVKRVDLVLLGLTFVATLFIGIELGILIGVGASMLWLFFATTRPHTARLGRLQGTRSYRSIDHFPDAETFRDVLILRMDAQFYFGNVSFLREQIARGLARQQGEPKSLVLDASSMNALDSTAVVALMEIIRELRERGIEIFISHIKQPVYEVMRDAGVIELLGPGHLFYEVDDAVQAALEHRDAVESGAPPEHFGESDPLD